jgi:hypothetical protein
MVMLNLMKVALVNINMIKSRTQMASPRWMEITVKKTEDHLELLLDQSGEQGQEEVINM